MRKNKPSPYLPYLLGTLFFLASFAAGFYACKYVTRPILMVVPVDDCPHGTES